MLHRPGTTNRLMIAGHKRLADGPQIFQNKWAGIMLIKHHDTINTINVEIFVLKKLF